MTQVGRAAIKVEIGWVVLNREIDTIGELRKLSNAPVFSVSSDNEESRSNSGPATRRPASERRSGSASSGTLGEPGGAATRDRIASDEAAQCFTESLEMPDVDRGRRPWRRDVVAASHRCAKRADRPCRRTKRFDRPRCTQSAERQPVARRDERSVRRTAIHRRRWASKDRANVDAKRRVGGDVDCAAEHNAGAEDAGEGANEIVRNQRSRRW